MKIIFSLIGVFTIGLLGLKAQTTLVITATNSNSQDSEIASANAATHNYGNEPRHYLYSWTQSGVQVDVRTLLQIDFSEFPANAIITNAKLELYFDPTGSPATTGDNTFWLERITAPWDENTVTWNTQPATDPTDRGEMQTYAVGETVFTADVTALITAIKNSGNNYGFMMKLKTESPYRNICFVSTENASNTPKLTIDYTLPQSSSVHETSINNNIALYPNPAQNNIRISTAEGKNSLVTIYDNAGRLITQINNYERNSAIDITELSTGIYYAVVSSDEELKTLKFNKL